MVRRYFTTIGRDEEKSEGMFTGDLNVGFIAGLSRIDGAFEFEIELMAKRSGIEGVIEDSLIRSGDLKNIFEDECGFTGRDA